MNVYDKKVIDVKDGKDVEGEHLVYSTTNGRRHQKWVIQYVDNLKADRRKNVDGFRVDTEFYIQSRMPMKRVIGGTSYVYMQTLTRAKSQRWKYDLKTKTIKSVQYPQYSLHVYSNGNGPYV
jgi:hypothetical protein